MSPFIQSNMEEADELPFVHVKHASREHARILTKTVVEVVIEVVNFHQLLSLNELWI